MSNDEIMQDDVSELLRALGLGDHARPVSCHAVMQSEIIPAVKGLVARRDVPHADSNETLALIAEHRLIVGPVIPAFGGGWLAYPFEEDPRSPRAGMGPTIGDAVRACVARIKGEA